MPDSIIKNGKATFGAFDGCVERLDIRNMTSPFTGLPVPKFLTNLRIKSSIHYMFSIGNYIGTIDFFDQKAFGFVDVVFWNKENKRKFAYRKFMGPRRRFIPHNMMLGFCASFDKNRYVRISWDKKNNRFSVIFNLKGDDSRPSARAAFQASYLETSLNELTFVNPYPSRRRCNASYFATPLISGSVSIGATNITPPINMDNAKGSSIVKISRLYCHRTAQTEYAMLSGIVEITKIVGIQEPEKQKETSIFEEAAKPKIVDLTDKKDEDESDKPFVFDGDEVEELEMHKISFTSKKRVSIHVEDSIENQISPDEYNNNFICVDGTKTLLPSVRITHLSGIMKTWVIQDYENMVDLTFTPSLSNFRNFSFFLAEADIKTIYGTFDGVVKTKDNEKIVLKNFEGIVRSQVTKL